jgi:hypothetical protein
MKPEMRLASALGGAIGSVELLFVDMIESSFNSFLIGLSDE